jgi:hypothetical protein
MKQLFSLFLLLICLSPIAAYAKPKEKTYNNTPQEVFQAALRTARERHVITYVDEKNLMFTFETGTSALSYGFISNASVEQQPDNKSRLLINVQHKNSGKSASFSFNAGDRMADKFFEQVSEELARKPQQKVAEKVESPHVEAPPQALPTHLVKDESQTGSVMVVSVPDGADVEVDGTFVGNSPATIKLASGKHTVITSIKGYKVWTRELSVNPGSEVRLNANLEKE